MADWGKILLYEQIEIPPRLRRYNFFQHLDYKPLHPQLMARKDGGLKGLENLGNSCYMNSCLQCLSFTKELSEHLVTRDLTKDILRG